MEMRWGVTLMEFAQVVAVVAGLLLLSWVLERWWPCEEKLKGGLPVECGYCRRTLGTRLDHTGIAMQGNWFCDTACYMGWEKVNMDERSLDHRG